MNGKPTTPARFFLILILDSFMHMYIDRIVVAIAVMPKKLNVLKVRKSNLFSVM